MWDKCKTFWSFFLWTGESHLTLKKSITCFQINALLYIGKLFHKWGILGWLIGLNHLHCIIPVTHFLWAQVGFKWGEVGDGASQIIYIALHLGWSISRVAWWMLSENRNLKCWKALQFYIGNMNHKKGHFIILGGRVKKILVSNSSTGSGDFKQYIVETRGLSLGVMDEQLGKSYGIWFFCMRTAARLLYAQR